MRKIVPIDNIRMHSRLRRFFILGVFFAIEFIDELAGSGMDAAWPMIRNELGLSYDQVGLLLGLPMLIGSLIDPFVSLWGDIGKRRLIVFSGGLVFAGALLVRGASPNMVALLCALIVFYPASSAFVNLSQASLMDLDPKRHEINMSRWAFAGSAGMVLGPLAMGGLLLMSLSWRLFFYVVCFLSMVAVIVQSRVHVETAVQTISAKQAFKAIKKALKTRGIVRWLVLIQCADLMLDVLLGYLALYLVDTAGVGEPAAALAVGVWTGVGLLGDFLIIPLLSRVRGLAYLRVSALCVTALFPLFLLVPWFWLKIVILGFLGLLNSGWYSILMAQIYKALPGKSGTALALFNISCLAGSLIPWILGIIAQIFGLHVSMWLLLAGPIVLLLGLRKKHIVAQYLGDNEK